MSNSHTLLSQSWLEMTEAAGALWTVMNLWYPFPTKKHCLVCWEMENLLEASLGGA